jgi:hypothetical protein
LGIDDLRKGPTELAMPGWFSDLPAACHQQLRFVKWRASRPAIDPNARAQPQA